jgi:hypothetical protein
VRSKQTVVIAIRETFSIANISAKNEMHRRRSLPVGGGGAAAHSLDFGISAAASVTSIESTNSPQRLIAFDTPKNG